jgi:hypothetical protein
MTPSSSRNGFHWFFKGVRGIASLPAIILMSAFVGFSGFAVEAGIPFGETVFMTGMVWALPAKGAAGRLDPGRRIAARRISHRDAVIDPADADGGMR